ncbi:hypothetical protein PS2015_407 [Pseudohongiella spirulinae]|uniref:Lipoprotein n=1 Tax=Pseudohongiella spirulinae TaxID=1249552 RepID=A0A0S2K9R5_9GAMM|nr:hypothetical protein PS2015_407 [Pseudohongiella spirulinae]
MKPMVYILFLVLFVGCSNRGIYESLQTRQKFECGRVPMSQLEQCLDRAGISYDEYQRSINSSSID